MAVDKKEKTKPSLHSGGTLTMRTAQPAGTAIVRKKTRAIQTKSHDELKQELDNRTTVLAENQRRKSEQVLQQSALAQTAVEEKQLLEKEKTKLSAIQPTAVKLQTPAESKSPQPAQSISPKTKGSKQPISTINSAAKSPIKEKKVVVTGTRSARDTKKEITGEVVKINKNVVSKTLEENEVKINDRFAHLRKANASNHKIAAKPLKSSFLKQVFNRKATGKKAIFEIDGEITIAEFSQEMSVKSEELIGKLMRLGVMTTVNTTIDTDTAMLVAGEFGYEVVAKKHVAIEERLEITNDEKTVKPRPAVVTVMGHVDHGKTTLLDYIRNTKVVDGESGGITQHIGAYSVATKHGTVTFLDTPGHAAFSAMRARGAQVTDIVILVIAADDKVMPQTEEAIAHANAAGVPLVVAVNKIDHQNADPARIMHEMASLGVNPEAWGGDTQFVEISALKGTHVDALLDAVALQGELLELTAPNDGYAQATVLEAHLDKGRGAVATILIKSGTLAIGNMFLLGTETGRVRSMHNDQRQQIQQAGPSAPIEITGISSVPKAGDTLLVVKNEKSAREIAATRLDDRKQQRYSASQKAFSLDTMFDQLQSGAIKAFNLVIKTDVQGSAEAINGALAEIPSDKIKLTIIQLGVGGINESDVTIAHTTNAIVLGFNTRAENSAKQYAEREGIEIRYYNVIYDLINDVKQAMSGLLDPTLREDITGTAAVKEVFGSRKLGQIAGCIVTEGTVKRNAKMRVVRDNVVIFAGDLESLRRVKDDVNEVRVGTECGIGVKNYNNVQVGDRIETYIEVEVQQTIE